MALYRDLKFNLGSTLDTMGALPVSNTASFVNTEKGNALACSSTEYAVYDTQLLPNDSFSIVVWAKIRPNTVLGSNRVQILGSSSNAGGNLICALSWDSAVSNALIGLNSSNTNYRFFNPTADKNYHCYIFTCSGTDTSTAKFYRDTVEYSVLSQNIAGSQSSRSTVKYVGGGGTAGAGALISRIKVYDHVLSANEIQSEQIEFNNAKPINKPKRGFILPKPSDLSPLVRSSLTSLFTDTFATDSSANYTAGVNITSVTWNAGGYLTFIGSGGFMTVVRAGVISTTLPVTVIVRAKSSVLTTTLGLWNGSTYVQSTETLGTEYKTFIFRNHTSSTATMTLRPNISLTAGQDLVIDEIVSYTETGLLAAYNMVKNGNTIVDISGNGFNGTISGTRVYENGGLSCNTPLTTCGVSPSMTALGTSNYTISFRVKPNFLTTNDLGIVGSSGSNAITLYIRGLNGSVVVGKVGVNDLTVGTAGTFISGRENTCSVVRTGTIVNTYIDGVLVYTGTDSNDYTVGCNHILSRGTTSTPLYGLIKDLKIYNRALSLQEIKDYHNSFVQPTLIENFSDAGADGITKTDAPSREWERVSGTWKLVENVVSNTQMVVGGPNFSTNVGWSLSGATISGGVYTGTTTGLNYCTSVLTLTAGKRYKVEVNILTSSNNAKVYVGGKNTSVLPVGFSTVYVVMDLVSNQLVGFNDLVGTANYLSITEAPQLDTMTNGTKYLENVSAGIIAIPSNTAYGSWEFDWFKGGASNSIVTGFISTTRIPTTTGTQGYVTEIGSDEALYLYAFTGSGFTSLMSTAISYIANSTWYRVRITRTTAGVFTVLIKGGAFTPTAGYDGWTLVSVSGGAGSNPVTNTTYTSSGYFTLDLDAGDRVANIVIKDGIKI